jgi:chromosomal replication initiator protein
MADQSHNTTIVTPQSAVSTALPARITVRRVLDATARHYGVTVPELLTRSRKRRSVRRRQAAAYVARKTAGRSLHFIADRMGGWDHTTILHSVRSVESRLAAGDVKTAAAVDAITAQVEGGANV